MSDCLTANPPAMALETAHKRLQNQAGKNHLKRMIVTGEDFPVKEGERRSGDSPFLVAGNQRLRSTLNWTPAYDDIEAIVRHALTWEKKLQASSGRVFRELSA